MKSVFKIAYAVAVVAVVLSVGQKSAIAQKSKKYRSGWTADETYPNIQFEFTRVRDPGGTPEDYFQFGYKNNSNKKLRISYQVSGAGLRMPLTGSVIVGANSKKGGVWKGMYTNGNRGGHLTSRITNITDPDNRENSIYRDLKKLDKELTPKKKKELSNKEIARILKDNQREISAKAVHHQNLLSESKKKSLSTIRNSVQNPPSRKQVNSDQQKSATAKVMPAKPSQTTPNKQLGKIGEGAKIQIGIQLRPGRAGFHRNEEFTLVSNGKIKESNATSSWSYSGKQFRFESISRRYKGTGPKHSHIEFSGTLIEEEEYAPGKRLLKFSGVYKEQRWHRNGHRHRNSSDKKIGYFYPDG